MISGVGIAIAILGIKGTLLFFITIEARIPQLQSFTISSGMNCDTSLSAVDNQDMEWPYPA